MNRALLVGSNAYPGNELNGCVNDVSDVANFLVSHCDFQEDDIRLLTDKRATTNAIEAHLNWLVDRRQRGRSCRVPLQRTRRTVPCSQRGWQGDPS